MTLLYNLCLLVIITINAFNVIKMQINNTLILRDYKFKQLKDNKLQKANLIAKFIK